MFKHKHLFCCLFIFTLNCAHSAQNWHDLYTKEQTPAKLYTQIVSEIDCVNPIDLICCQTQEAECKVCEDREMELKKVFEIKCRAVDKIDCQKDVPTIFCCAAETFECMSCNYDALRRSDDYSKACAKAAQNIIPN